MLQERKGVYHGAITTPNTTVISLCNTCEEGASLPNKVKDQKVKLHSSLKVNYSNYI